MPRTRRRKLIVFLCLLALPLLFVLGILGVAVYFYFSADFMKPSVQVDLRRYALTVNTDSLKVSPYGRLVLSRNGLWEGYIKGSPIDRGAAYGVMAKELLEYQESVFVSQIRKIVPSESRVHFLHKLIAIFNRNMAKSIPAEYREEIYGVSLSGSDAFNEFGSSYERQLNYHAAHDIGHAMQQYMLVGCSSFAAWGAQSEDGELIVGRNFDFYVGDDFAKNKMVLTVKPDKGYSFISVSWPGMMGVLSGMNQEGLTITINAAKGPIPSQTAMPISLLARQILQYAATIDEAFAIVSKAKTFVAESLLIASVRDGRAAIIEKTPKKIALYDAGGQRVVSTNHYQSDEFKTDKYNVENIQYSDSPYRHRRINQLIDRCAPLSIFDAASILRNRYGIDDVDIGIGNEKSVNQYIAHHSVIFKPKQLKMWVSTSPWQLGKYVCFDFSRALDSAKYPECNLEEGVGDIPADSLQIVNECRRVREYRELYLTIADATKRAAHLPDSLIQRFLKVNPNHYQVYNALGNYMEALGCRHEAISYWRMAISLEVPRRDERDKIVKKIQSVDDEE